VSCAKCNTLNCIPKLLSNLPCRRAPGSGNQQQNDTGYKSTLTRQGLGSWNLFGKQWNYGN
jgi:hypothetical protein